jgi:hypothetical protein
MKYLSGEEAQLGDLVRVGDSDEGLVVCSIDTDEYSSRFPRSEWALLERGILVEFDRLGLIHYRDPEQALAFLRRAK